MSEGGYPETMRTTQRMLTTLHERRSRHLARSRTYRIAFAFLGFAVLLTGVVLALPLVPGPGLVVMAIGLGMLALEFVWAERALEGALRRIDREVERVQRRRARKRGAATAEEDATRP